MKQFIIILAFIVFVYIFNILTYSNKSVYNGISLDIFNNMPSFSYEDGTEIANTLKN